MIATFFSLKATRIGGLALGYAAIVLISRADGPAVLGQYLYLLNCVIVVGTLAALGMPTLVQRLSAKIEADRIGVGTWFILRSRWPLMLAVAAAGGAGLLALDSDHELTLTVAAATTLAAVGFALTLVLVEALRIARGSLVSELLRNVVRPALILVFLLVGMRADWAVWAAIPLTLIAGLWLGRSAISQRPVSDPELAGYVAERGRDLGALFVLGAIGLVFGTMDVVLFGLVADSAETGIYGAASRYGMLVNVALLAGNAQMVRQVAKIAANHDPSVVDVDEPITLIRRHVRLVRFSSTGLLLALALALPLYSRLVDLPLSSLWPYFAVVGFSFWLQGVLGPVNMFLMQAHEVSRLIQYHLWGLAAFCLVAGVLLLQGATLAIPLGAAAGANTVKVMAWLYIWRSRGIHV